MLHLRIYRSHHCILFEFERYKEQLHSIAGIALGSISFLILLVWGALLAMFTTAAIKNIDDIQKEMDSLNTDEQEYFYDDEGTEEDSLQSDEETYFIGE